MATPDPAKEVADTWESVAPAWEEHRDQVFVTTRAVSDWLVDHAEVGPGDTVLELASGPGETGFLAAERIGPDGTLISSDVSSGMVDASRRGAQARGLANVEHRVIDAHHVDLPDDSVDAVLCRFALMLMPDPGRALAEVRRVLRPGRRIAYATWGAIDRNAWVTSMISALLQNGHMPGSTSPFEPGGVFSLASAEANQPLLDEAGFTDVVAEEVTGLMHYPDATEYLRVQGSIAGPVAGLLAGLDAEGRAAVMASLESAVDPYRSDDGIDLPWTAVVVSAAAPG
jgi:ubiquinone/menaquinone biosynthesis C-methylase UbiE